MTINPYQPSNTIALFNPAGSGWTPIARFGAAIYGCVYIGFCLVALIVAIQDDWPPAWIMANVILDVLTAYGIFAMVLPMIRYGRLFPAWRVFAWVLPIYLCVAAVCETLADPQPLTTVELVLVIILTVAFVAPAIALNFMLRDRLRLSFQTNT